MFELQKTYSTLIKPYFFNSLLTSGISIIPPLDSQIHIQMIQDHLELTGRRQFSGIQLMKYVLNKF